jgi:hypothetical protein
MSRLSNISVTGDLQLSTKDVTSQVAANVLARMIKESQNTRQYRSHSRIAVTIQSENVEIVHDFSQANKAIDLSATLIEVNVSSLFILMTDYKQIILKSGKPWSLTLVRAPFLPTSITNRHARTANDRTKGETAA